MPNSLRISPPSFITFAMLYSTLAVSAIALSSQALAANLTSTSPADVAAARNSALTLSPTSNVKGKVFDRFVTIWLENTDYDKAASDPNLAWLAKKGITLSNYNGVTHPSEPNYVASIGGDNFGMDNDDFNQIPGNVSSIIDLLEDKGYCMVAVPRRHAILRFRREGLDQPTNQGQRLRQKAQPCCDLRCQHQC
jgi:hypothetical protein